MIDQTSQFFAILTNVGAAKQANADALGVPWKLTEMGVGDANGTDPIPSAAQTSLINEWRRRPLNQLFIDPVNPAVIVAEQVIPADEGGYWIREIGLYDADGDLVAVANCPPSFKPIMSQGSGRTQVVRMNFIVSSTSNITLKIDPSVVLATREFVERRIQEELYKLDNKQSVRVATTANIALTGLQTIDGVSLLAGDRVLVKNQTASKDNGIYVVGTAAWQRAPDADSSAEVTSAMILSVEQGATLADTRWQLVTDGTIVLGTTALAFQNITQGFAPLNSPALINPTANTPPLFDNTKSLATTEYVMRSSGNYRGFTSLTSATTLTASAVGTVVTTIGAFAITMPAASALPAGGAIHFRNIGSGVVTVNCTGADSINSGAGQITSIELQVGATLTMTANGVNAWWAAGSAQLQYSKVFGATPAPFDSSKLLATAEFVQREKGSFASSAGISGGNVTLTAAHVGTRIEMSANGTLTLPKSSTLPKGSSILITTSSAVDAAKLALVAGDTLAINNVSVSSPYTMSMGSDILLVSDGEKWRAHASLECLRSSPLFAAIFGANGHQVLPSGWIFKIGHASTDTATGTVPVTFPVAFPNACMYVGAIYAGASTAPNPAVCQSGIPTRTGFTGFITNVTNNAPAVTVGGYNWLAIGY
ncbi:phage tail protein [Pseudomonas brassicacearum]|uniref:phage tail protein n=1 Tax=Pseudomonas brassicacearum TaxID=930166 RepID=UPI002733654D|nr:phage tail protein [Pseudomonas brassicacearum]WLG69328.1 phage tail protein [Pseudomonas brassicacearum]